MGGNQQGTMTKEIIDVTLDKCKQLKPDNWIELFGGEPMLEPELCVYAAQKAHSMGLGVSLYTNGYWGESEDLMRTVRDEISPEYIMMSIDDFHTVPEQSLKNAVEFFKPDSNKAKLCISAIKNHCSLADKFKMLYPDLNIYYENLREVGISNTHDVKQQDICRTEGWLISPDGKVTMACEKGCESCYAGNIFDINILERYSLIEDHLLMLPGDYRYEYCNSHDINIFDKSTYIDNPSIKLLDFKEMQTKEKMYELVFGDDE